MSEPLQLVFGMQEWIELFLHYLSLSLLSIGGAITTAPDMHRFLGDEQHIGARRCLRNGNRRIELRVSQPVLLLDQKAVHVGRCRYGATYAEQ